jgi:tetratricopeptide (TPR) repeat protein
MKLVLFVITFYWFTSACLAQLQTADPAGGYRPGLDARQALQDARSFYENGKISAALFVLDSLISREPAFAQAFQLRGKSHLAAHDSASALTDYTAAVHLSPDQNDYRFQRGILAYQLKRHTIALADFHHVLKDSTAATTTVYFKGKQGARGFTTSGVTTLQSDMRSDLYHYLGLVHLQSGQLDSAGWYLEMALRRNPWEADILVNRGLLHIQKGDTLEALKDFQQALVYQSSHPEAMRNLHTFSSWHERQALLEEVYDKAVATSGTYQAHYNRALMRQQKGEHRKALPDFDRAIDLAGPQAELLLMRAYSREYSADLAGAAEDYQRVIRLDPTRTKAYTNLGNVYYKLKQYDRAVQIYRQVLPRLAGDGPVHYNAGLANYMAGNQEEACFLLKKALSLGFREASKPISRYCH